MADRGHGGGQAPAQRAQLGVDAALDTLAAMFSDFSRDVIKMVLLESCGGNMETAVEALLIMSGSEILPRAPASRRPPPAAAPASVPRSHVPRTESRPSASRPVVARSAVESVPLPSAVPQSVNLPDDFLRPPSYFLAKFPDSEDTEDISDATKALEIERRKQQEAADELFAKRLFEDALFTSDLSANPEWAKDGFAVGARAPKPSASKAHSRVESIEGGRDKLSAKLKMTKLTTMFKKKKSSERMHDSGFSGAGVDPSDPCARQASFKDKVDSLSKGAREKLSGFAEKLKLHKEGKSGRSYVARASTYHSALASIDDDPFLESDLGPVESPREENRGTYVPPKPLQDL